MVLKGERTFAVVERTVGVNLSVLNIIDNADLIPDKVEKTVFFSLQKALQRPEAVVNHLQANNVPGLSSQYFNWRCTVNAKLGTCILTCRLQRTSESQRSVRFTPFREHYLIRVVRMQSISE